MAGSLSDFYENAVLNHAFAKTSLTFPTTLYLALCTTIPTDASTGTSIVEANYTGYARKSFVGGDLNSASAGVITNSNPITFAACTAGTSTVVGVAICDALTVGNMLAWSDVTSHVVDVSNTPATVAAGSLSISLT